MKRYTGKTLDECLAQAAQDKGVAVESLRYTKTEEKSGFLNLSTTIIIDVQGPEDIVAFIETYLTTYFKNIDLDVKVNVTLDEGTFNVLLDAENNAILIGRSGATLHAINTVLRGAVNAQFKSKVNVLVDINGYKQDRYEKVRSLADRMAKNVLRTKIAVVLDPLPNDERKVIHQHLSGMPHIKTESIGEGSNRRLKILYVKDKA
jgi:spoIIIJ-associated protein